MPDNERRIEWRLKELKSDDGFRHSVQMDDLIEWKCTEGFAIVVPDEKCWLPGPGFSWSNNGYLGNWPAVFSSNGIVQLYFSPVQGCNMGDFEYRIAIPRSGVQTKSEAAFPSDSDYDIVDATIVWNGGVGDDRTKSHK